MARQPTSRPSSWAVEREKIDENFIELYPILSGVVHIVTQAEYTALGIITNTNNIPYMVTQLDGTIHLRYNTFAMVGGVGGGEIPVTSYVDLTTFANISGLVTTHTGTISSGSPTLTLTAAHDFKVGHGIAIKAAGAQYEGWLRTYVTAVNGNVLTLANNATATATAQPVHHDDSAALQSCIDSMTAGSTLKFNVPTMNIGEVNLKGGIVYDGIYTGTTKCKIYNPLYFSQTGTPDWIYKIFGITGQANITFKNFEYDGRKANVIGNDQGGTAFIIGENVTNLNVLNNYIHDNWYAGLRMLESETNIIIDGNQVDTTDVAFCFMAKFNGTAKFHGISIMNNTIDAVNCNSEAIAIIPTTYNWRNHTTGQVLAECDNILIKGNTINKPGRVAVIYGGSIGTNIIVEDNTWIASMFAISSLDGVIELKNAGGTFDPTLNTSSGVIIRRNVFGPTQYEQLRLCGANITLDNNTFGITSGAGSLICSQDSRGTTGVFEIKNHNITVNWKAILADDATHKLNGVSFHDNIVAGNTGLGVIQIGNSGVANIQNNTGGTNMNITVKAGSTIETADWATVTYT